MRRLGTIIFIWACLAGQIALAQESGSGTTPAVSSASGALTLPEAVNLALKNNPSIQAADAYADAVRQGIAEAQSSRYPRVDFSEDFTRGNNPVFVFSSLLMQRQFTGQNFLLNNLNFPSPVDNFRTLFSTSMPLYDAGKTSRQIRGARLDAEGAQRARERTRQEIIFSVIQAYTRELLAQQNVRVATTSVKSAEEDLARAQARQDLGQALLSDVLLAEVQLARAQEELIDARNEEAIGLAALNVAMGIPEDSATQVQGALAEIAFDAGTVEERQRRALASRPDYHQTLIGKERAHMEVGGARAAFLPTLNAFGSWEADNQNFVSHGGNSWTAGASLNFNIFDGGLRRARVAESNARVRQAAAMEKQLASAIRLQVREAFLNLNASRQRVEVSRQSASQVEESLRILRDRYETGLATMTDILNTETAHARAQRDFLNAVFDYRNAYATLELATGELAPNSPAVAQ
jgi:outer membrane protein TolC